MATTNDQSGETPVASDQPGGAANAPDLDALVQKAVAAALEQTDKRFQGFQSTIDKKLDGIQRQFKTAGLSPEQQEQLEAEDTEDELARLRRENEIFRNRDKFPKGADLLARLSEAETLEDQLGLIEAALAAGVPAAQVAEAAADSPAGGDETPVPEVDRNNPPRPVTPGRVAAAAGPMTDEIADAILSQAGKGALAAQRRAG